MNALRQAGAPVINSPYDTADAFLKLKGVTMSTTKKGRVLQAMQLATGQTYGAVPVMPGGPRAPNRKPRMPRPPKARAPKVVNNFVPTKADKDLFYASWEWQTLRKQTLNKYGAECQCCGAVRGGKTIAGVNVVIHVDHIKPLSRYWHLRLSPDNTQVLCAECNQGKGAWDETDHRPKPKIEEAEEIDEVDTLMAEFRAIMKE